MVWNCQGAASAGFHRTLKQLIWEHKPSIVCLLEPKVSGDQANAICAGFGFSEWVRVEAFGFSGGIWILWKETLLVNIMFTHPQFAVLQVGEGRSEPWFLSVVYGSPNLQLRRSLFSDLSSQSLGIQGPWLTAGDYNTVASQSEVSNPGTFNSTRCSEFNEWIFREGLIDLGFEGPNITWRRGINSETFKGARFTDWIEH
ncbi:PREDICTED: uncharacterized protein LOC109186233 [Ipomoea nil]|uniref:uncharacterized protein LOC109186233 n=1 Tax=Ipomoea nil TaxID=35883 RepID=UPI000901C5E5|nr:PREDICTED: uncharacterized protein LOC109186233 [Ipomoea nil]